MKAHDHFRKRWRQRGIESVDVDRLFTLLRKYKAEGRDDILWHCKRLEDGGFWGFEILGRRYYAIFKDGQTSPATVYDHELYRRKLKNIKKMRKPRQYLKRYMDKKGRLKR